jgi:hypothetical protein
MADLNRTIVLRSVQVRRQFVEIQPTVRGQDASALFCRGKHSPQRTRCREDVLQPCPQVPPHTCLLEIFLDGSNPDVMRTQRADLWRISRTLGHHVVAKTGNASAGRNFPQHRDILGTARNGMRAARAEHASRRR